MTRRDAVGAILVLAVAVASFLAIVWAVAEVGGRVVAGGGRVACTSPPPSVE